MADWKEQSLRLWKNLEKKQKYAIIGLASLLFLVILIWSYWWGGRPDNVILFTNLEAKDAGEVVAKLKELKIPYEIQNNGSTVLVSPQNVLQTRLDLAAEGLPRGNKGFELFEQSKFGVTDFQNKVNLLQAIQGELARTIEQMDEIERARVHIVLPEDSLYKKNEKPATASIMLKIKINKELSKEQVKGIVNLVAHSVQGLKAENITVVDSYARILNEQQSDKEKEALGVATLTHLELTKKVREELEKTVQTLLDQTLGRGKAAARVSVELNFDQKITESQTFAPVVDDKGVLRSSQDVSESYTGTSNAPQGIPGTTTNIPGYVTTNPNSESEYDKKEAVRNYEVNEIKEKVVNAPGAIRRMTVAVLVDSAIPQEQRDSISRTVALAVGINTARGDSIVLEGIPFSTEISDKIRQEEETYAQEQQRLFWLKVILVLLGASAAAYFAIGYRRRLALEKEAQELAAGQVQIDLGDLAAIEAELSPQEKERQEQQDLIKQLARSKPEEVAQLVKVWIDEE